MTTAFARRKAAGEVAHAAGLSAEGQAARDYERRGLCVAHRRWRGRGGEIDLVLHEGDRVVFVEVKQSRSLDHALERLRPRQIARLFAAAAEYLDTRPRGSLTETRFDLAVVDPHGAVIRMENAFGPA